MADGQLIQGIQIIDSTESSSNDITVCSWEMPTNTIARIEITCILQRTINSLIATYKLAGLYSSLDGYMDGYAQLINSTIKYDEEGTTPGYEVILATNETSVVANTASNEGSAYRVVCIMHIYSVEQSVSI